MPESVLQEPWPRSSNDEFQKSTPVDWLAASNGEGRILMAARIGVLDCNLVLATISFGLRLKTLRHENHS